MTTYPDINWEQPIQTTTGRHAQVVGERWVSCPHSHCIIIVKLVCVESPLGEIDPYGNVHQISKTGHRMDSRAPESEREPLIRNVPQPAKPAAPAKREKWIILQGRGDGKPLKDRSFARPSLLEREAFAIASLDEGEVVAQVTWKE